MRRGRSDAFVNTEKACRVESIYLIYHRLLPPPVLVGADVEILLCTLRSRHFDGCCPLIYPSCAKQILLSSRLLKARHHPVERSTEPQNTARLGAALVERRPEAPRAGFH